MLQPTTSGSLGGLGPHTRRMRTGASQSQQSQQSQPQQPQEQQQQRRESVRILVLGDAGVGKSSLVSAFVSQCFPEKVPSVLTPVQIPASESPDNVATLIMDTPANAPQEQLVARVKEADAIVVVYDASRQETHDRLSSHWLPLIEKTLGIPPPLSASQEKERAEDTGEEGGSSAAFPKPVVLAANKVDLLSPGTTTTTHDEIDVSASGAAAAAGGGAAGGGGGGEATESVRRAQAVMERFRFALQSFDVSAKRQEQVADVFVMAQRLVVYPFGPLFDVASTDLTPKLKRVLARAFRLFDADRDGLLSDAELNALQLHCFKSTLQEDDIKGVKKMVGKGCSGGVRRGGLTQEGFLEVVRLFLFNMQVDMPWAILRTLGYDDELEWESPADWAEVEGQLLSRATPEDSWELTPDALRFLGRVFDQFGAEGAKGRAGRVLGREELAEVFSVLPSPALPPWDAIAPSSSSSPSSPSSWRPTPVISPTTESCMDAAAWVAGWQLTAALDPVTTVRYLLYLGAAKAPEELVHPHPRWQRPGRWPPSRRCKSGSGGWGHTHHPPTRAVFYALLFTPSPLFSAHAASQQAATRLFDGLLALHSHSHGREGLRAGARLLSLQTPEEQARQSQSPAPPSSPSSFQTVQTALSTTAMKPVKQAAETSGRGAPGQAVVALVLEGRAASLAVTAVPAAMTEEGVERGLAADVALLPYHPDDPASVNRALDLAASLQPALPRVFVELWPPSDQLAPDGVHEACAAQPDTHACVVVDMAQQEGEGGSAGCDALAHEVIAMCHARFGPGPAGGGGRGRRGSVRGGGDGRGLKDVIMGAVRASMEEADPAVVAAVVGVATLGMIVLVARVVGGGLREGGRRG